MAEQQATQEQNLEFAVQRIYTKDSSFESPNTPEIFRQEWEPEMKLDIQTKTAKLDEENFEVELTVTTTVKSKETVAFVAEVKQAGIFTLKHFSQDQLQPLLGSICPSIIYPYARERISSMVTHGGFPQLVLAPINFDALYAQHVEQQGQQGEGGSQTQQ